MKKIVGLSLVEIMVAVGLLSAVSVGVMNVVQHLSKSQKTLENLREVSDINVLMRMAFEYEENCNKNLKGKTIDVNKPQLSLDEIKVGNVTLYKTKEKKNGVTLSRVGIFEVLTDNPIKLGDFERYFVHFTYEGEIFDQKNTYGKKDFKKNMPIAIIVDPKTSEIVSCFGDPSKESVFTSSNCKNGDVLIYQNGKFVCESNTDQSIMKNYSTVEFPCYQASSGIPNVFGEDKATLEVKEGESWKLHADAGQILSGNPGLRLFETTYKARTTGKLRMLASIPVRMVNKSPMVNYNPTFFGVGGFPMTYDLFRAQYEYPLSSAYYELTALALLNFREKATNKLVGRSFGDLYNSTAFVLRGSLGGTGLVLGEFPVVEDQEYNIEIRVFIMKLGGMVNGTGSYASFGCIRQTDHVVDGYLELIEFSSKK